MVIETVKLAEDSSGDVIVRLYEAHGSRARTALRHTFAAVDVYPTDLLERRLSAPPPRAAASWSGQVVTLELRPFQLVTLRFVRG